MPGWNLPPASPARSGGGVAMNAGAYGGQLSDVLIDASVLLDGEEVTLSREAMEMGYRTTLPLRRGLPVLSARFRLTRDDPAAILARMKELNARRREKQPLSFPSAGSTFKRPEGHFAGALIEAAGLKGLTVGGAQVSEKHAGFIINRGGATAGDVLSLIARSAKAGVRARGRASGDGSARRRRGGALKNIVEVEKCPLRPTRAGSLRGKRSNSPAAPAPRWPPRCSLAAAWPISAGRSTACASCRPTPLSRGTISCC